MAATALPIETPALRLRPFVVLDAAAVFDLSNEALARRWLPSQVYADQDHARSVLEFLIGQYEVPGDPRHGPTVLAIEHRIDAVLIGHVGFSPLAEDVEIGFAIAQAYHRRGLATAAIIAASRWALQRFALDRIVGITSTSNHASKRCLERAGFVHEDDRTMLFQCAEQEVGFHVLNRPGGSGAGA